MGRVVGITYCGGGTNQREIEILGDRDMMAAGGPDKSTYSGAAEKMQGVR